MTIFGNGVEWTVKSRFRLVKEEDLYTIMLWRMLPEITQFMCTDPKLTIEDQKIGIKELYLKADFFNGFMKLTINLLEW